MSVLALVIIASLLTLGYAAVNYAKVKKMDEGTEKMAEIAAAIRIGANAFINYEHKILLIVTLCSLHYLRDRLKNAGTRECGTYFKLVRC